MRTSTSVLCFPQNAQCEESSGGGSGCGTAVSASGTGLRLARGAGFALRAIPSLPTVLSIFGMTPACSSRCRCARHFAEHLARPVLPQSRDLSVDALAVSRYPRVAENHWFVLHQNSATKKANRIKALILVRNSRILHVRLRVAKSERRKAKSSGEVVGCVRQTSSSNDHTTALRSGRLA
jgi:hypothetical protein